MECIFWYGFFVGSGFGFLEIRIRFFFRLSDLDPVSANLDTMLILLYFALQKVYVYIN